MGMRIKGGTGSGGIIIPPSLPDLGVPGWDHYWHPDNTVLGAGGATGLTDAPGLGVAADNLIRVQLEAGAPEPLLMTDLVPTVGMKYLHIAGTDLQGQTAMLEPRSFVILCKFPLDGGHTAARMCGAAISRHPTSHVRRTIPAAGPTLAGGLATNNDEWGVIVGNMDPSGPVAAYNGVDTAIGAAYTPAVSIPLTAVQAPILSVAFGLPAGTNTIDVGLRATWPFALDASHRASVYGAIKAAYPLLGLP